MALLNITTNGMAIGRAYGGTLDALDIMRYPRSGELKLMTLWLFQEPIIIRLPEVFLSE